LTAADRFGVDLILDDLGILNLKDRAAFPDLEVQVGVIV
jgi:hypothetical protein